MNNRYLRQEFVETGRGKIFYLCDLSFPNRPTIVFIHGLSSNHTTWLKPMEILRKHKYNVLSPDLRGHGFSDKSKIKKNYRLEVFSEDLRLIIEKERIKNFVLAGYSFGGQIAFDYASKNPEQIKGLVLLSANHTDYVKLKKLNFLAPIFYTGLNLLAFIFLWQKRKEYAYYEHGRAMSYWQSVIDGFKTMPLSINFWMLANVFKIDLREQIKKIKAPAVLVFAKNDPYIWAVDINDMTKRLASSKIIYSKNPNHFIGTNSQDETIEIILNFLDEPHT